MKKLLLVLTILTSVSAFAQQAMTITLDSPATSQVLHKNEAFEVKATITNSGTVTIMSTDSIYIYLSANGNQVSNVLLLTHGDIPVDSSVIVRLGYPGFSDATSVPSFSFCMRAAFSIMTPVASWSEGCNSVSYVNYPVGVKELAAAGSLQVYPNPAVDVLNITFNYAETTHMTIMDMTGRTVKTMPIENGSAKVNVNDMAKGVYLYSITTNDGQLIKSGKFSVSK